MQHSARGIFLGTVDGKMCAKAEKEVEGRGRGIKEPDMHGKTLHVTRQECPSRKNLLFSLLGK